MIFVKCFLKNIFSISKCCYTIDILYDHFDMLYVFFSISNYFTKYYAMLIIASICNKAGNTEKF
jgi:hypothetical protein